MPACFASGATVFPVHTGIDLLYAVSVGSVIRVPRTHGDRSDAQAGEWIELAYFPYTRDMPFTFAIVFIALHGRRMFVQDSCKQWGHVSYDYVSGCTSL